MDVLPKLEALKINQLLNFFAYSFALLSLMHPEETEENRRFCHSKTMFLYIWKKIRWINLFRVFCCWKQILTVLFCVCFVKYSSSYYNCMGNTTWKEVKNGMNMLQKMLLKMKKWRFCGMSWSNVTEIKTRKPNIVVVNKNERSCAIIDIAIPGDIRVSEIEKEKLRDTRN